MPDDLSQEIFPIQSTIQAIKTSETDILPSEIDRKYWNFTDHDIESYEQWWEVFGKNVVTEFLEERKRDDLPRVVVDIAGGEGEAVRSLARGNLITAGLTINLSDLRTDEQKEFDALHNLYSIPDQPNQTGDVLRRNTWNQFDQWLDQYSEEGYADCIIARPGGAYRLTIPPESYAVLLKRTVNRLTANNGLSLLSVPGNIYEHQGKLDFKPLEKFIRELNQYPGLKVDFEPNTADWDIFYHPLKVTTWSCGDIRVIKNADQQFAIS